MLRQIATDDPWVFLTEILCHPQIECDGGICCNKKRGLYEPLHRVWCEWAADDSVERKILLAPRGHFKSSVISFADTTHSIIRRPNIRILLISALEQNATNFCKQVKTAFQNNARMKWVFPEYCVPPDEQFGPAHSFITPARTDHSQAAPTFTAAYLDAALASQHYDKIIMDDPIEARHVATEEQASKSRSSYNKIIPLLDPSTPGNLTSVTVLGTRWAYFDLYSGLIPEELGGTATNSLYKCIVRAAFERDGKPDFEAGDPIFPTRFSREKLMGLLEEARMDDRLGEQFWWNQYMNACRAPDNQPFLENWFAEFDLASTPPLFAKMLVCDTALKDDSISKKGARGDYTVILVVGWDKEGRLYVIDGVRSNAFTSKLFTDALVTFAQKYNIPTVVRQKVSEDTVGTQIRDAFYAVRLPIDYRPIAVQGMGRKVQRIKDALQAPMQRGEIMWGKRMIQSGPTAGIWEHHRLLDQCRKELLNLGQYPVDDVADCLANCFHPEIKFMKTNLVGPVNSWKVPSQPTQQVRVPQAEVSSDKIQRSQRYTGGAHRRGAGWTE